MSKKTTQTENGSSDRKYQDKPVVNQVGSVPREYYDGNPMLRYNPLWAMILGERSVGKSFWFKKKSIITPDSIWIYLRRTDVLRKDPKNWKSYTSDLLQAGAIDPDAEYKSNSEGIWVDGMQKVIFSALSTDSSAHSMTYLPDTMQTSIKNKKETEDSDKVIDDIIKAESTFDTPVKIKKYIVFEEIIEPKNKYLKNEVEQLFEFYNTVDRYSGTQLFGIANLMTAYNPYFDYFGITPFREEFRWYKNKTLLVQNVKVKAMEQFVKSQRFYNLVAGTDYAEYLTNNTPWQDDNYGIEKKPAHARPLYNMRFNHELFGIWYVDETYYISKKHNPQLVTYASLKSIEEGDLPMAKNEGVIRLLNYGAEHGLLRFESIPIRDMVYFCINGGYRES